MIPKAARKIMKRYENNIAKHNCGIEEMPNWLKRLVKKCTDVLAK
jgi:hypothetical protein